MKAFPLSIVLFALTFCAAAQIVTNEPSHLKCKITYHEGEIGSGTSSIAMNLAPVNPGDGGALSIGQPGDEHGLKWVFVGRNRDKDVYRINITRMAKAGSSYQTTISKEVEFDGTKVIISQDDLHTVVMESPNKEDLKSAQSH